MTRNRSSKGQAAVEFFLTYGWAIIIILAIMAILYSTIFKPEFYVAEQCQIAPGLACDNFKLVPAAGNAVNLTLQAHNTMGFDINITSMNFTLTDPTTGSTVNSLYDTVIGPLNDGDSFNVTVSFPVSSAASPGTLYTIKFSANFTDNDVTPTTMHRTAGLIDVRLYN